MVKKIERVSLEQAQAGIQPEGEKDSAYWREQCVSLQLLRESHKAKLNELEGEIQEGIKRAGSLHNDSLLSGGGLRACEAMDTIEGEVSKKIGQKNILVSALDDLKTREHQYNLKFHEALYLEIPSKVVALDQEMQSIFTQVLEGIKALGLEEKRQRMVELKKESDALQLAFGKSCGVLNIPPKGMPRGVRVPCQIGDLASFATSLAGFALKKD